MLHLNSVIDCHGLLLIVTPLAKCRKSEPVNIFPKKTYQHNPLGTSSKKELLFSLDEGARREQSDEHPAYWGGCACTKVCWTLTAAGVCVVIGDESATASAGGSLITSPEERPVIGDTKLPPLVSKRIE